ncbi:MAG: NHL repeat-containing protein [Aliidongia sp.]
MTFLVCGFANFLVRRLLVLILIGCGFAGPATVAQTIVTLGSGFKGPNGIAVDASGNVFIADDTNSVKEISATGGNVTVKTLSTGVGTPGAVAIDSQGNVFAVDAPSNQVYEILAAGGYTTFKMIGGGFNTPLGVAVDGSGNVFVADSGNHAVKEVLAQGGYVTVRTLGGGGFFSGPRAIAVDGDGNVFVADSFDVDEIPAAGDYATIKTLGGGSGVAPKGVALDRKGDVFFTGGGNNTVEEIPAGSDAAVVISSGFFQPTSIAADATGNVFVHDVGGVSEILAAGGYTVVNNLGSGFVGAFALATDANGNLFFSAFPTTPLNTARVKESLASSGFAAITDISAGSFDAPEAIAVDSSDNVFIADVNNNAVKELLAASGYTTIVSLGSGFGHPTGIAVDGSSNVFVADSNSSVKEILAAGGYVTGNLIGTGFAQPQGVAFDRDGNVFVADTNNGAVKEIIAAGGNNAIKTLGSDFPAPVGVAVDGVGNVFVANFQSTGVNSAGMREVFSGVQEIPAVGDGAAVIPVASGFFTPKGIAVDGQGNVFVADSGNNAVKEVLNGPPVIEAAVLPGSRSVEVGTTPTLFATMINTGPIALEGCQITLSAAASTVLSGGSLSYQTTDSATNSLTGAPNQPVTISGNNGSQSFLVSFPDPIAVSAVELPLGFNCGTVNVLNAAAIVSGVDTVDLTISTTPVPDIIALAVTATNNGIIELPNGGTAAFAVASLNAGATATLSVSVDTGAANLPLIATICETNPATGQCLAAPAASLSLNYANGETPTFSVFLQSSGGAITFAPATSRVFVRFKDADGRLHGSTSVAIETE